MALNATSSTSFNAAFPSRADGNKSSNSPSPDSSKPADLGSKADVFSSNNASEKKPKEMPWYISFGKSLLVMTASGFGALYGLRRGLKSAVAGYMVAGAATGGALTAIYQKCANGKIDKNGLFKNILIGAVGF